MKMLFIIALLLGTIFITGLLVVRKVTDKKIPSNRSHKDDLRFQRRLVQDVVRCKRRKNYASINDIPNHIMRKKVSSRRHSQYIDRDYK
jgi:regulatory protein YycI of two-component signal transduction system YycFG